MGDFSRFREGDTLDLVVQEHRADRAGKHFDVRIGTKDTGLLSWATRKGIPGPSGKVALFQQPVHRHEYGQFEGEIASGYGKGTVRKHDSGKLLVTKVDKGSIHLTRSDKRFPERFVLAKPRGDNKRWLLINSTPTEKVPYDKIRYRSVAPKDAKKVLDNLQPGSSVQAKIDGAAALTKLLKGRAEVVSYRVSKETGRPIVHTERMFKGRPTISIPKKYVGSVLRGELYGTKGGKVIPPQELGGILNSSVDKSIRQQVERGVELKKSLFDIQQVGAESTRAMDYQSRSKVLEDIIRHLPEDRFELSEGVLTPKDANALLKKVLSGKHPLTREGVVIHPPMGKPTKIKAQQEHDVYVTGTFPGKGRLRDSVGGVTFSTSPGGKTVGKIGTGFSDALRSELARSPSEYIGRIARVRSQERLPSGALRAPSLIALHEDYPMKKSAHLLNAAKLLGFVDELQKEI